MAKVYDNFEFRTGTILKNRIVKASMSEAMATADGMVRQNHIDLYRRWSAGGASLLITGNVMVDGRHANEPLVVDGLHDQNYTSFCRWAETGKASGTHIWPQLSHPGKQSPKIVNNAPVAPSEVPLPFDLFEKPRALNSDEIWEIVERFGRVSRRLEKAGFTGVQLHGAHGYLISQFLSPHHNRREDEWGGSMEKRLKFLTEIYKAVREQTSDQFHVSVKLNSSDFQKGGFGEEESIEVAKAVDEMGVDLIEISGGSWENPINRTGKAKLEGVRESTIKREAYFLEYAEKVRSEIKAALMVTGGFRSSAGIDEALSSGAVDFVGVARPFALDPDFANHVLSDPSFVSHVAPIKSGIKKIDDMAIMEIAWYTMQLARMSEGKLPKRKANGVFSAMAVMYQMWKKGAAVKKVRV